METAALLIGVVGIIGVGLICWLRRPTSSYWDKRPNCDKAKEYLAHRYRNCDEITVSIRSIDNSFRAPSHRSSLLHAMVNITMAAVGALYSYEVVVTAPTQQLPKLRSELSGRIYGYQVRVEEKL